MFGCASHIVESKRYGVLEISNSIKLEIRTEKYSNSSSLITDKVSSKKINSHSINNQYKFDSLLRPLFSLLTLALMLFGLISGGNSKIITDSTDDFSHTSLIANNASGSLGENSSLVASNAKFSSNISAAIIAAEYTKNDFIKESITQVALKTDNKIMLPTTDSDVLVKKQPVDTTGTAAREIQTYEIVDGDNLVDLATRYNITSDTIRWANNLKRNAALNPGDKLIILPTSGVLFEIKDSVQTLDAVAEKFKASKQMIISYNNLSEDQQSLAIGTQLIVPDGVIEEAPEPVQTVVARNVNQVTQSSTNTSQPGTTSTVVQSGNLGYNNYSYGYCTWYVANRRGNLPPSMGDARNWYYAAQSYGFAVGSTPQVGAVAWTPNGYYGHVAYVEAVDGSNVLVSEMNFAGGWNVVSSRWVDASSFSYIY